MFCQDGDLENANVQADQIKQMILEDPSAVLEDKDVIRALISAEGSEALGRNVVDLRGVLVDRLEDKLNRLEGTHRHVIAAAYENLAGTQQVHRAVLALLNAKDFASFLWAMTEKLPSILGLEDVRLCVEADGMEAGTQLGPEGPYRGAIIGLPTGAAAAYCGQEAFWPGKRVILRGLPSTAAVIYGEAAESYASEAVLKLEIGEAQVPMLLALASKDAERFRPEHATDLLAFLALSFESVTERWLN